MLWGVRGAEINNSYLFHSDPIANPIDTNGGAVLMYISDLEIIRYQQLMAGKVRLITNRGKYASTNIP